jgi:hypothetical protein
MTRARSSPSGRAYDLDGRAYDLEYPVSPGKERGTLQCRERNYDEYDHHQGRHTERRKGETRCCRASVKPGLPLPGARSPPSGWLLGPLPVPFEALREVVVEAHGRLTMYGGGDVGVSVARPRGLLLVSARTHNAVQVENCTFVRCQGTLSGPSYPQGQ